MLLYPLSTLFILAVANFVLLPAINAYGSINLRRQIGRLRFNRDISTLVWRDSTVSIVVPASRERAYGLYSSLDQHPSWSPWLHHVDFDRPSGRISTWTLKSLGLTFSWKANNTIEDFPNIIQWEALSGFENRGRVEFYDSDISGDEVEDIQIESREAEQSALRTKGTKMVLTISYNLPRVAIAVLDKLGTAAETFIEDTLLGDLKRFQSRLLKEDTGMSEYAVAADS